MCKQERFRQGPMSWNIQYSQLLEPNIYLALFVRSEVYYFEQQKPLYQCRQKINRSNDLHSILQNSKTVEGPRTRFHLTSEYKNAHDVPTLEEPVQKLIASER